MGCGRRNTVPRRCAVAKDPSDKLLREVGARVRSLRKKNGVSLDELADRLDVSPQWVSRMEVGEENLGLRTLWRIAHALVVRVRDLMPE